MEYKVIIANAGGFTGVNLERAAEALTKLVNEAIADGWEPLGGISTASAVPNMGASASLQQAMVKRA